MIERMWAAVGALGFACSALACGWESGTSERLGEGGDVARFSARRFSVVVEGCTLDAWQKGTMDSASARRVVREVLISCPTVRSTGVVDPVDAPSRDALASAVSELRKGGYQVRLVVTFGDQLDRPYPKDTILRAFADPAWRSEVVANLGPFAAMADGLELFPLELPSGVRDHMTALVTELRASPAGRARLGVLAPPSIQSPSDVPGGDAVDVASLAPRVDAFRFMTLDFSCCGAGPGPTLDAGWAVDVARFGRRQAPSTPVDLAVPLYGTDFSARGERSVGALEARAIAAMAGVTPTRHPGGELHFSWKDASGVQHETWYDDAVAASRALRAWDDGSLPDDVGVVFYGLGAEDPKYWDNLARGLP